MSAEVLTWHDEHLLDHRRRLRTSVCVSLAVHGLIFALFAASPPSPPPPAAKYLAVDLVTAPPSAGRAGGRASPPPAAPAKPPPPAPPATAPASPPPVTKAPVQVLPEETPGRIREAKPEPKVVAKVQPKPAAKPPVRPRRRQKEESLSLEDAMAAFEDELGVDETASLLRPQDSAGAPSKAADGAESDAAGTSARVGQLVSPEEKAWSDEVKRRIKDRFPSFARFRGRGLTAQIGVVVLATGDLSGEPKLLGTSGDLDFDRIAIAVVERAAPLPPPPSPGARTLNLVSEER